MTQWQLEGFRRSLEGLLQQTLAESDQLSQALGRTDHFSADESDRATLEAERNLLLAQAERQHRLCREVRLALCRVEQGRYGFCDECGEPIGLRRLEARPTARLCKQCQEEKEDRGAFHRRIAGQRAPMGMVEEMSM